jgi:hypothetical protein
MTMLCVEIITGWTTKRGSTLLLFFSFVKRKFRGDIPTYGGVRLVSGAAYSFLAFQNGVFLTASGNQPLEFHQRFSALAIAVNLSANKGFATEPLRVNSPPPKPMCHPDRNV